MIKLEHLGKYYRHQRRDIPALHDINLHIRAGEIFGVVGQSGAGKSTLIRCVNLLERPTQGRVVVDGVDLTQLRRRELLAARRQIGMIFQHFNLLSSRTAYRNIALPLELEGLSKSAIDARIRPLLELTGLAEHAHHYPIELSGGQKQRVAIARALASNPKVLLSDEATSALDPQTTHAILQLLEQINRELGLTILLITHEMDVIKKICKRVALIERGRLIETGTVEEFFTAPQSESAAHFVNQSLQLELPEPIARNLKPTPNNHPVIQLIFNGQTTDAPLISHISRHYKLDVNIIQAKIEYIQQTAIGMLNVELGGEASAIAEALAYIATLPVKLKVLGYLHEHP